MSCAAGLALRPRTAPPAGVNFKALPIRLISACATRSASHSALPAASPITMTPPLVRPVAARSRCASTTSGATSSGRGRTSKEPGLEPLDVDDVVDQPGQPLGAAYGHVDDVLRLLGQLAGVAVGEHLQRPADRGERRAQLVADRADELALHLVQDVRSVMSRNAITAPSTPGGPAFGAAVTSTGNVGAVVAAVARAPTGVTASPSAITMSTTHSSCCSRAQRRARVRARAGRRPPTRASSRRRGLTKTIRPLSSTSDDPLAHGLEDAAVPLGELVAAPGSASATFRSRSGVHRAGCRACGPAAGRRSGPARSPASVQSCQPSRPVDQHDGRAATRTARSGSIARHRAGQVAPLRWCARGSTDPGEISAASAEQQPAPGRRPMSTDEPL